MRITPASYDQQGGEQSPYLSLLHLLLAAAVVVAAVVAASATTTTTTTAGYSLIRQHYLDEDLPDGVREPGVARGVDILDVESVQHDLHVPVLMSTA